MTPTRVSVWVTSDNHEIITRAAESFTRAAIGLGLEGVDIMLTIGPDTDDETTNQEDDDE